MIVSDHGMTAGGANSGVDYVYTKYNHILHIKIFNLFLNY